jgi:hypothetical protein
MCFSNFSDECDVLEDKDFLFLDEEVIQFICSEIDQLISEGIFTDEDLLEEMNREAMLALTDPKRRDRGKRVNRITFDAVTLPNKTDIRVAFRVSSQTGTQGKVAGTIRQYVEYIDILGFQDHIRAKGLKLADAVAYLKTAKLRVYCSCPDFFWNGAKYNLGVRSDRPAFKDSLVRGKKWGYIGFDKATGRKYEEEFDVTHAPNKRDPMRKHILCKHLYACVNYLPNNFQSILSQSARKMNFKAVGALNTDSELDKMTDPKNKTQQAPVTFKSTIVKRNPQPPTLNQPK